MGREFDRSVLVGIVLLTTLVAANAAVSLWNTRHVHGNADAVAHAHEVMTVSAAVRADVRAMEAAQRTFLLTGTEAEYEDSGRSEANARVGLSRLRQLTADNAAQQSQLAAVGDALDRTARRLEDTVRVRRRDGGEAAARVVAGGASRGLLDETERRLAEVEAAERALLADRERVNHRAYSNALLFGVAAAGFGLLAVGGGVGVLLRNARARAAAAAAVHREREWLRTTLASIGDAVIATDAAGNVTFLNPVAEALTGWPQAEASGLPLTKVFHIVNESTRREVENPALRALREGVIVGLANHTVLIARDGTERPIDDSAAPIRDAAGRVGGAVLVFRDITERKRAEEAQARLAAIVESSDDAIVGKTLDGVIRYWNAGAERVFGYPAAEAVGRPIALLIPPERLDEEKSIIDRLKRGERVDHFETVRVTKDGRRVDISLTVSPIRDSEGHVIGASKVARDVTDRRRAEAALRESEGRFRAIVEATPECVKLVGPDGTLLQMNNAGLAMVEGDGSALGQCVYNVIAPEDRGRFVAFNERVCRGERGTLEFDIIGLRGTRRHMETTAVPLPAPQGGFTQLAVARDVTARKHAERERAQLHARVEADQRLFDAVFDALPVGLVVAEPGGRLVRMNRANEELWGSPPETNSIAEYEPWVGYWPDTGRRIEPHEWALARVLTAGERVAGDLVEIERFNGGGRRHVLITGAPARDADGRVVAGVIAQVDVTDRRRAEAALRERDERLQLFLENATDYAVIISDPDDRVVEWLGGAERITGWRADEALGQPVAAIFTPEDRAAGVPERETAKAAAAGRAEDVRWHQRNDGSRFLAEGVTVSLRGPSGELRGFGKVFRDATDEKRAEDAVRASEARFRALFDSMDQGFCVIEVTFADGRALDYRFVELNPAFERHSGLPRDLLGRSIRETVPALEEFWFDTYGRVAATGEPTRFVHHAAPLGRWFEVYAFRLGDPDRHRVAVLFTDVTERKRVEEALREADRKKDDFIALLAHELRNPLAPIRNGLQVIRLSEDRATRDRSQKMMDRQLSHMVRMIDDLLDVSRIGRHKMELRRSRVALADVVTSAVETARPAVEEAGHELSVALPPEPVHLDADLTRLSQVISNLLTNSAKYTERGGKIGLSAEPRADSVVVTVRDTGIGIPPAALPAIFDMFSQVDRSTERSTGGLGIGLALVKGLVEMHGGTVTAASEGEGRGSEFTVTLPTLGQPPGAAEPVHDVAPTGLGVRRRVLVVDDNRDGAESLSEMLLLFGHEVRTAHDGLEAVEAAGAFRPEVILMDVGMPRLDGLDATRRIREQPWGGGITIVALTGWGQEADRERTREAGCDGHLVKPVSLPDLEKLLAELRGRTLPG